jgi:hypothetical protein
MKSKLEEKKLELADTYSLIRTKDGKSVARDDKARIDFEHGFSAGIQAYKEMLEGVGVEGAKVRFMCDDESKWQGLGMRITDDAAVKYLEALPVLAKLQQQAEKIESLVQETTNLRGVLGLKNDDYVRQVGTWKLIQRLEEQKTELESRLKEAESVIEAFASLPGEMYYGESDSYYDLGSPARQYMEKVK